MTSPGIYARAGADFLFNTLHAIASLVRGGEPGPAVAMIAGLSDLLRYSLDNAGKNVVPLSEDLAAIRDDARFKALVASL